MSGSASTIVRRLPTLAALFGWVYPDPDRRFHLCALPRSVNAVITGSALAGVFFWRFGGEGYALFAAFALIPFGVGDYGDRAAGARRAVDAGAEGDSNWKDD